MTTVAYISTNENKMAAVEIDDESGSLIRTVQTVDPIVDQILLPESMKDPNTKNPLKRPVTEWMVRKDSFLFVLTSFWGESSAIVTTFKINATTTTTTTTNEHLQRVGESIETGGLQACHALLSPSGDTLCVAHYIDGMITFFDVSSFGVDKSPPTGGLDPPKYIVETPELVPGTRTTKFPSCLPSLHHAWYHQDTINSTETYLLVSDVSSQGRVWTFAVDEKGMPKSVADDDGQMIKPTSNMKVTHVHGPPGWLASAVSKVLMPNVDYRIRRTVVHPNGLYAYLVMEMNAVVQVYEYNAKDGKIYGDCLQESPTIDPSYFNGSKWTGVGMNAPAEVVATDTELFVSNRGLQAKILGSTENSVRIFRLEDKGRKMVPFQCVQTKGPIRHFWLSDDKNTLLTATHFCEPYVIEKFVRRQDGSDDESVGKFVKVGEAEVDFEVACLCV
jgi:6-phosphogluconolactonase (cycloisomerase 2 family)